MPPPCCPYDPGAGRDRAGGAVSHRRHGDQRHPWLLELVAGIIDEGETAEAVVRREAVEELGSRWDAAETRHQLSGEPGWQHRAHRGVRGRGGCQSGQRDPRSGGRGNIRVPVSREQAYAWLKGFDNAASVIALQWLALNHGELRARWLAGR